MIDLSEDAGVARTTLHYEGFSESKVKKKNRRYRRGFLSFDNIYVV